LAAIPKPGEDWEATRSRTVLHPTTQAAVTLKEYEKTYGDLDLAGLRNELSEQTRVIGTGDLQRAEAMLATQAHTLDAIYNNCVSGPGRPGVKSMKVIVQASAFRDGQRWDLGSKHGTSRSFKSLIPDNSFQYSGADQFGISPKNKGE